jgi:hypothetical protein
MDIDLSLLSYKGRLSAFAIHLYPRPADDALTVCEQPHSTWRHARGSRPFRRSTRSRCRSSVTDHEAR